MKCKWLALNALLSSGAIALFVWRQGKSSATGLAVGLIGVEGAAGLQAALGFGAGLCCR